MRETGGLTSLRHLSAAVFLVSLVWATYQQPAPAMSRDPELLGACFGINTMLYDSVHPDDMGFEDQESCEAFWNDIREDQAQYDCENGCGGNCFWNSASSLQGVGCCEDGDADCAEERNSASPRRVRGEWYFNNGTTTCLRIGVPEQ